MGFPQVARIEKVELAGSEPGGGTTIHAAEVRAERRFVVGRPGKQIVDRWLGSSRL